MSLIVRPSSQTWTIARVVESLRRADWMTGARAKAYATILLIISSAVAVIWIALSRGGIDPTGKALGTDFTSFWAASKLALSGRAPDVYDPQLHYAVQKAVFGGRDIGDSAFFYPPVYLLICLPLAILPYLAALAAWIGVTGFAYWRVMRRWMGGREALALPIFAFPAVFETAAHGQNAFLVTALFGLGLVWLAERPFAGGLALGALAFKPQMGLVLPIAFLARGRWRAFAGASLAVLSLSALSLLVFGPQTWMAFFKVSGLARAALERNLVGNEKMVSVFAGVRLWGGPLYLAYAAQALMAAGVAAALIHFLRRKPDPRAEGAAIAASALLFSPFLLDYDLTLLALPMAWVAGEGLRKGWLPWEKLILMAGFVLPVAARGAAMRLGLPIGPPVMAAVFWIVLRRGRPGLAQPI